MKRNPVKSGLYDQRDRAKRRGRQDRPPANPRPPQSEMLAWLERSGLEKTDVGSVNLTRFLRDTAPFDIPPEERLRQLAIHLESEAGSLPGKSGWRALKRIYDHALKLNKDDAMVWNSMGIAACEMTNSTQNPKSKKVIFDQGEAAALKAIEILPNWSHAHQALGRLYYYRGDHDDPGSIRKRTRDRILGDVHLPMEACASPAPRNP